jgi:hypothetical protein
MNELSSVRDAVTWHAIGSYHDPITCQVTAETDRRMIRYWPFWALTGLVRAQHGQSRFLFSERLPGHSRRRYFAYGRILLRSDHMQSIDQNYPVSVDVLAILCAPSCLGAHKMIKRCILFLRTASRPFAAPILCMWSDRVMIRPHAKLQLKWTVGL